MTVKKSAPTKNTKTTQTDPIVPSRQQRVLRWLMLFLLKMFFIGVGVIFIYSIYLDSKVRKKFEGQRWQVPVQVYGQIERIAPGDSLPLANFKQGLLATGYKNVTNVTRPGEFSLTKTRVVIYRRAFDFGAGLQPSQRLTIELKHNQVNNVYLDDINAEQVLLEPILLDRILPQSKEDRVLVSLEAVPATLLDTLLLVEDRDFYFHAGVSPLGILRAIYQNLLAGRTVQGGSTLTQQLVKNMFLTREKTLVRKVNEALMALILEYRYSKDQLLEAYINEVYLGQHYANGIYGFGLAAEFYFGKSIQSLNPEQMAMLVGQIKGPSYYDPWRFPERTLARRDLVLRLMYQQEILSQRQFEQAVEAPLSIRKNRRLRQQKFPAYLQLVKAELGQYLSEYEQQFGVRVFTGFSIGSQLAAQQSISEQLPKMAQQSANELQAAMVVSNVKTAAITAMVGGRDASFEGFNRALHAKRPIGSLIKPAVYLAALERYQRFNLATLIDDKAIALAGEDGQVWRPKNYDGKYRGQVTLLEGLVSSLNIPTVNIGMSLGLENVVQAIHLLGYPDDIVTRPSLLLGSLNMSPRDVHQLYVAIANKGFSEQSHAIERIVSRQGETIWQFQADPQQVLSTQAWYLLDYALTQVATTGTARSLSWRLKNNVVAGKTGTTNEQRDSWFVGYDNEQLVTSWVGRDDNKPTNLTGSSGALVLFADFMRKHGVVNKRTELPTNMALVHFDRRSGRAVSQACTDSLLLPALTQGLLLESNCQQELEQLAKKKKSWFEKLFGQ